MCSAEMVALIDECITEINRMTCTPLVKLQNDTVACFDRQVTPYAMLNSRKYEVPDKACKLLAATLQQTKYHVKIALEEYQTNLMKVYRHIHTMAKDKVLYMQERHGLYTHAGDAR